MVFVKEELIKFIRRYPITEEGCLRSFTDQSFSIGFILWTGNDVSQHIQTSFLKVLDDRTHSKIPYLNSLLNYAINIW